MREPDMIINGKYLKRWFLIPKNRFFNIYLHCFGESDDDRALHDHPWWNISFLIKGELVEHTMNKKRIIPWFIPILRSAKTAHRLELIKGPAWTIFITGPKVRSWGFHCPNIGWRHWKEFTSSDGVNVGKGCE